MSLNLVMPEQSELRPRITVFGVGGAGGNAVNNMIDKALEGAEFVVANTDAQALQQSRATRRIQLGTGVTQGLGAGAKPEVGCAAAEESLDEIVEHLSGAHMCFITAGMGGGTGTGAAPVIARAAREMGVLTVGVVTKPFHFEGAKRMRQAEGGIAELQKVVDTLIIIPNQNLFRLANERTTFAEAFMMADDVLYQGVKGVTDLMVRPGLINLDFADVRSVMDEMGKAMMGTGEAEGENRAIQAAEKAIANPLLDEISLKGARGVLINITGGYDLTLFELDEAANRIRQEVDPDANIIVGSTLDPEIEGVMRVSVVATGIDAEAPAAAGEAPRRDVATPVSDIAAPARQEAVQAPAARAEAPAAPALEAAPAPAPEAARVAPAAVARDDAFIAPPPETPAQAAREVEPSPEVLARLREAVRKQPEDAAQRPQRPAEHPAAAPAQPAHPARPAASAARPVAPRPDDAERGRFGISSLIHRMTGGAEAAAPRPHREPRVGGADLTDEDRQRDIPAFLRRQAN